MATFQAQVTGLTNVTISSSGTNPIESELSTFLTDGAKEIINILPLPLKEKCASITILDNDPSIYDMDAGGEVLSVTRLSADSGGYYLPCRQVPSMYGDLTNDSGSIHYATGSDPAYWITSNSSGVSTLFVKPTTTAAQPANVYRIAYPSVAYSDSVIANFPNEAEYLVTLYAACKVLQNAMGAMNSVTAIDTTAFAAIKADLDECLTIADDIHTEVGLAKVIAAELKTQTANSDNMETACDAINTALARIATYNWEDEDTFHTTSSQLTRVKDALDNAQKIIDDGANSPTGDALFDAGTYLGDEEDVELVQGAIAIASSEIQRAQAHIAEWTTIIDGAAKEANGFVAEVQARAAFSGAKAQAIAGYIQTAQGYASEIQSKIGISTGYLQEAKIRMEREMQKYQWYQSQQVMLKQDYERGIQMLVGGGAPQPPARGERE